MSPEAFEAMQNSALGAITSKAGSRLPVMQGKDPGLPKAAPVFDLDELRKRNSDIMSQRKGRAEEKRNVG